MIGGLRLQARGAGERRPLAVGIEQVEQGERQIGRVLRRGRPPRPRRPPRRSRAFCVLAASSCSVLRRRAPRTRSVVSVTVTRTPPTSPLSSRIGLYEKMK